MTPQQKLIDELIEPMYEYFDWDFNSEQAAELRKALLTMSQKTEEALRVERCTDGTKSYAHLEGYARAVSAFNQKAIEWRGEVK